MTDNYAPRELVWHINSNLNGRPAATKPKPKEPGLVKTLIEKTFQKLSTQLLERMSNLEQELRNLQTENAELKNRLNEALN
ncbi:MAG: hypothetical protein HC880_00205 [Bacteroidia bacterium]|nr:hypothetical protein [Bacteroidia bacterium]